MRQPSGDSQPLGSGSPAIFPGEMVTYAGVFHREWCFLVSAFHWIVLHRSLSHHRQRVQKPNSRQQFFANFFLWYCYGCIYVSSFTQLQYWRLISLTNHTMRQVRKCHLWTISFPHFKDNKASNQHRTKNSWCRSYPFLLLSKERQPSIVVVRI